VRLSYLQKEDISLIYYWLTFASVPTKPLNMSIIAYAQEQAIDLIVMSTHGHSGFKRFFLGSVTDRVIRAGQTPVLVVPAA
jgi:nucleotide-binding universal stress UspA family protein